MKTQNRKKSLKLYDVAAGPMYLIIFGLPLLILIAVALLVALAGKLIAKAQARNEAKQVQKSIQDDPDGWNG